MTQQKTAAAERLIIHCFHCKGAFDVLKTTVFCGCLVREPTIKCSLCGQCFCKAPIAWKSEFWRRAPTLLTRRLKELRGDDAPGRGATALSYIPAQLPDSSPLVLVVDDSRTVRMVAARTISDMGFRVAEAANAEEALLIAREQHPVLILTDALMPKMDGREMCKVIKMDAKIGGTIVVLMSGLYTATRYKTEAIALFGADDYLVKPVEAAQLRAVLARFLIGPANEDRLTA